MIPIYQNSTNDNYESIKVNFIVRTVEYDTIISSLINRKSTDSIQHELILGRRGSGKSTLLKRLEMEIIENDKLNKKYIPVNPAEEQAGVYRLFDLWEKVLEELACRTETKMALKNYSEFTDDQTYTRYLYSEIHAFCVKQKRQAVLLLDNFDRIVINFSDDGNLLRETLINYHDLVLITASTRMDEHFWQYDQPFYEFFRRHRLEMLSSEETFRLLNHWAASPDFNETERHKIQGFLKNYRGKVENVRLLTDGLPRTMLFFLNIVLQNENPIEADLLKKVMDEVTPLYQERLQSLAPQMRKMVQEMAFFWEACSTKELAERCRMESKLVAANLKTLSDKNIVETIVTDKRQNLYRISERFFNMWLIVTQGNPEQKRKARWLSIFLESWYDKEELQNMAKQHIENLKQHKISQEKALLRTKSLAQSKHISILDRDEMIELTNAEKNIENRFISLPQKASEIYDKISEHIKNKDFKKAVTLSKEIENENGSLRLFTAARIAETQRDYHKAKETYRKAIKNGNIWAVNKLAVIYYCQGQDTKAEKYYLIAIEKGDNQALNNLALLYKNQKKYAEAEKYYLIAIEKGVTRALNNLAVLYKNQEKYAEAEKYYLIAIENGNISALYNLANMYNHQEKYAEAEKYYLIAIERGHNGALNNLALMYYNQKKYAEAEKYYLIAIEKGNNLALLNLALMYYNQNKNKEKAKQLISKYEREHIVKIIVELWTGIFNDVEKRVIIACEEKREDSWFIEHLLVHHQKSLVDKLFHHATFGKRLQEQYTALYYVSQILNGKQNENNLWLRIPPELKSTVQDIQQAIEEKQKKYYGNN
ncbi:MAG: tetratricopeptide repeat protein [Dysgonamonadaceae bacterium]|jgi:TPR repeat protein/energy-coupling factor transporter ATP-binding protein EcfA2|nr:tetratricopeptide repeat protein [Dysgonamonadaceae bacterium]